MPSSKTVSSSGQSDIAGVIARELGVEKRQVDAVIDLLNEGATVPFIARYRKERTGGLDDTQLRSLADRLDVLRQLDARRETVLKSIAEQDKLTHELEQEIRAAATRIELEDLYAPFKPKRRTKAMIAREAGLAPLAEKLLADPTLSPETISETFVDAEKGVNDNETALEGARQIIVEKIVEAPKVVQRVREKVWKDGQVASKLVKGKEAEAARFEDYFKHEEPIEDMPSHRALALLRGEKEGVLKINLDLPAAPGGRHVAVGMIMKEFGLSHKGRAADGFLTQTAETAWKARLKSSCSNDLFGRLKERADSEAIKVFSRNVKDLLLAAPAGAQTVMGIDPGIRTGCKVAIVDATGKLLETTTIYPHEPRRDWDGSLRTLEKLCRKHDVTLVSVGNGTASRETDKLVAELSAGHAGQQLTRVMVSEAGASVYSASELAAKEFPDLDVSLRGAVSIARRLQDPLAELVKIEPKAIGVGQYQHDVDQSALSKALEATVEDCVNAVGVDVNTASEPLLTHVAGLNATLAANIVAYRNDNGPFASRAALKKVPRMGPRSFEQAAGFLRVREGKNPLDASAVHPEAYPLVERIAKAGNRSVASLIGDEAYLRKVKVKDFVDDRFGAETIRDILKELEKPGRDPRGTFKTASFQEGVESITDLTVGMQLEGVVTNVTNFGAFVDIGVHQDGLVHISQLADRFVQDPHDEVSTGDVVSVRVMEVDTARKRISLTMKNEEGSQQRYA